MPLTIEINQKTIKTEGMGNNAARNVLLFLMAFLGLGALLGGGAFIISPGGELSGMPVFLLDESPFRNYLIPGIFLFVVLGILPVMLIIALLRKPESKRAERFNFFNDMHWSWTYSVYIAFVLILWLQIQMVFLSTVFWLHTVYMIFAVIIIFVALLPQVRDKYEK